MAKKPAKPAAAGGAQIAKNRKAFHDYEILEQFEAGLVLQGTEVKSLRAGQISFQDAHARFRDGHLWLVGVHISPYSHGNWTNHEPERPRKLLLHKRELRKLKQKMERQNLTLVPLELYFCRGWAKAKLGLARGKKKADKRDALRKKDDQRAMARQMARQGRDR